MSDILPYSAPIAPVLPLRLDGPALDGLSPLEVAEVEAAASAAAAYRLRQIRLAAHRRYRDFGDLLAPSAEATSPAAAATPSARAVPALDDPRFEVEMRAAEAAAEQRRTVPAASAVPVQSGWVTDQGGSAAAAGIALMLAFLGVAVVFLANPGWLPWA